MNDAASLVFLVDDDASVRRSLARLLRSAGYTVESFASASEFLSCEPRAGPSCLVLDIRMPGSSGLELQDALLKLGHGPPIVYLTGHGDVPTSVSAMKKGAIDFLTKPVSDADLLDAIRRALSKAREAIAAQDEKAVLLRRLETLTPREKEVYRLVAAGMLNKQVADRLRISEKTVKVHRGRVMRKMRAESLAQLVRSADRTGLL